MTTEHFSSNDPSFQEHPFFISFSEESTTDPKRQALQRCCRRVEEKNAPGSKLLIDYLFDKYLKNQSHYSIQRSCTVVLAFLIFLESRNKEIYSLTYKGISDFVEYEQARGLKVNSVIHNLEVIEAFLSYLVKQKVLPYEIKNHHIRLKKPEVLPRAIPKEDMQLILAAINTDRDRALLLLLLRTGMRIGELLKVKTTHIIFREQKILIYQGEKNYQGRVVYYSTDAGKALQRWLRQRPNNFDYLFATNHVKPISYSTSRRVMTEVLQRAQLEGKKYSLHSLRHTFATDMLNAGMRIEVLQQLLGHQEIGVTMRYAKLADQTREREYFQAMDCIEKGDHYEPKRINNQLRKVFEEKKLFRSKHQKLSE